MKKEFNSVLESIPGGSLVLLHGPKDVLMGTLASTTINTPLFIGRDMLYGEISTLKEIIACVDDIELSNLVVAMEAPDFINQTNIYVKHFLHLCNKVFHTMLLLHFTEIAGGYKEERGKGSTALKATVDLELDLEKDADGVVNVVAVYKDTHGVLPLMTQQL